MSFFIIKWCHNFFCHHLFVPSLSFFISIKCLPIFYSSTLSFQRITFLLIYKYIFIFYTKEKEKIKKLFFYPHNFFFYSLNIFCSITKVLQLCAFALCRKKHSIISSFFFSIILKCFLSWVCLIKQNINQHVSTYFCWIISISDNLSLSLLSIYNKRKRKKSTLMIIKMTH